MGFVPTHKLKPKMILAESVRDVSGRLLLAKGNSIQPAHIRIFKIWGITEVDIAGSTGLRDNASAAVDSELLEKTRAQTRHIFKHTDLQHPAIKEIFRLSVTFRSLHGDPEMKTAFIAVDADRPRDAGEEDFIAKLAKKKIKLPEIPSIVFELNEVIANPFSSANDIAAVVNKSPSLTTLLLKICNSSFYGFPSKIDKVSRAVMLIGTREISSLALGISIISIFKKIPRQILDMYSFLKHSLACGIIARILGAHKNLAQTEQLFISGLIHDLGRLILYVYFPEASAAILSRCQRSDRLLYRVEKECLGCDHTDIINHLLQQWKLPPLLESNIFFHHRPSEASHPVPATIVHLADILVNALGIGSSGEKFVPPLDEEAWSQLDLAPSCFEMVLKQATHQFFSLERILQG